MYPHSLVFHRTITVQYLVTLQDFHQNTLIKIASVLCLNLPTNQEENATPPPFLHQINHFFFLSFLFPSRPLGRFRIVQYVASRHGKFLFGCSFRFVSSRCPMPGEIATYPIKALRLSWLTVQYLKLQSLIFKSFLVALPGAWTIRKVSLCFNRAPHTV